MQFALRSIRERGSDARLLVPSLFSFRARPAPTVRFQYLLPVYYTPCTLGMR